MIMTLKKRDEVLEVVGMLRHVLENEMKNNNSGLTGTITVAKDKIIQVATPIFYHKKSILTLKKHK